MKGMHIQIRGCPELISRHRMLILVYMAALLFDTLSTIHFMLHEGIDMEFHPLVRIAAYSYGPVMGPFLSAFLFKFVAGVFIIFYLKRYGHLFVKTAIVTALFGGVFNYWGHLFPL